MNEKIGIDICPHCRGTDIDRKSGCLYHFVSKNMIVVREDLICENCGKPWILEYTPNCYYLDDNSKPQKIS